MEFREAMDLFDYWAKFPPAHVLLREYVGFKPKDAPEAAGPLAAATAKDLLADGRRTKNVDQLPPSVQARIATLKKSAKDLPKKGKAKK